MRIAIPRTGNEVSAHFGHCDDFILYDIENDQVVNQSILANPEHQPGFLPGFLHKHDVNLVIAGGMGSRAIELFEAQNIKTITGVSGSADEVIKSYLAGTLVGTNEVCKHEHGDGHDCNH